MFKLMAKHTSTNLSNTTSKENDYNYYYSLGVNGTGFNRHGFAYYNDTVIQYIGQNQILAKYPNKDNYYLTMNISSANDFLNNDIGRFPVVTK